MSSSKSNQSDAKELNEFFSDLDVTYKSPVRMHIQTFDKEAMKQRFANMKTLEEKEKHSITRINANDVKKEKRVAKKSDKKILKQKKDSGNSAKEAEERFEREFTEAKLSPGFEERVEKIKKEQEEEKLNKKKRPVMKLGKKTISTGLPDLDDIKDRKLPKGKKLTKSGKIVDMVAPKMPKQPKGKKESPKKESPKKESPKKELGEIENINEMLDAFAEMKKPASVIKKEKKGPKSPSSRKPASRKSKQEEYKMVSPKRESPKKPKECPEGKMINPKTGRCIKIKVPKEKKSLKKSPQKKSSSPKPETPVKRAAWDFTVDENINWAD